MTTGSKLSFYWDSNVFLSYLNGQSDRTEAIRSLWTEVSSANGNHIFTSTFTIAEVAFVEAEKLQKSTSAKIEKRIDDMWKDPAIKLVEAPEIVMRMARSIMRKAVDQGRRTLKPPDAIHLATAIWLNENVKPILSFHTYDKDLEPLAELTGLKICEPIPNQYRIPGV